MALGNGTGQEQPGTARSTFPATTKPGPMFEAKDLNMTTTTAVPLSVGPSLDRLTADVEIVVPVYNEEQSLAGSVDRLQRYLSDHFPLTWLITVADNASTDNTWGIACRLAKEMDGVRAMHLSEKGRGRALRAAVAAKQRRGRGLHGRRPFDRPGRPPTLGGAR